MIERLWKNGVIIPSFLFSAIATLMLLKELPSLSGTPQFTSYLIGRIIIIGILLISILLAMVEFEFIFTTYPIVFYFVGVAYGCHGQLFQPNYWLAYIQVTSIFPFIFYTDKRILAILMTFGIISFDTAFIMTSEKYVQMGIFSREFSNDILIGTIISTIISYVGASVFFNEKIRRNQLYQRFIDLGKNISSIVHDIKGMISGPCTYIDILSQSVKTSSFSAQDGQVFSFLKEDIYAMKDFVMEMNLLVSSHITNQVNPVRVSDVIHSIMRVFKSRIKNVEIVTLGDMMLLTTVDHLNRILINSIINSCDAIHKNGVLKGKITIYCENYLLGIADNSGEKLSTKTLKNLNDRYFTFSDKKTGSGLGILLIKDYVTAMGGKYKYSNHVDGVNLEIRFPHSIILKTETH